MSKKNQAVENRQKKSVPQRRTALKSILVSGGLVSGASALPKAWTKPVIDSVVLPSHAATTDDTGSATTPVTTPSPAPTKPPTVNYFWMEYFNGVQLENSEGRGQMFAERVLDTLVPTANAGVNIGQAFSAQSICLAITGNSYLATVYGRVFDSSVYVEFQNVVGTVGVVTNLPSPVQHCGSTQVQPATILVNNVAPGSCDCTIHMESTSQTQNVPVGDCQAFYPPCTAV